MSFLRAAYIGTTLATAMWAGGCLAATPWYETSIDDDKTSLVIKTDQGDKTIYSESHALLIGEVNYEDWPKLTAVPAELANMAKALERQHFKVELYFDLRSDELMDVVDGFIRKRGTIPDSRVFVYIAAHGESRDEGRPLGYILPVDAAKEDAPKTDMAARALSMQMFSAWAQSPDPRHMFFVFDSCFSGAFFGFRGKVIAPNPVGRPTGAANPEGFMIGPDGQLVAPPPKSDGLESSDYALSDAPQSRGRQFLSAGDSNETVPGKSVIAQLVSQILDDRVSRVQINADYWTTGDELGIWIQRHAGSITRGLLGVPTPPNPVFGRLPNDDLYAQGDMLFSRADLPASPVVKTASEEADWAQVATRKIDVAPVLVASVAETANALKEQAGELTRIATEQRAAADALQAKVDETTGLEIDNSNLIQQVETLRKQAASTETTAKEVVQSSQEAQKRQNDILSDAGDITAQIQSAINDVVPPKDAGLNPDEERQLRSLIDSLSSADTATRRTARVDLEKFIADLPPAKTDATVNLLLTRMSEKSYHFQLGVAQAIAKQKETLSLEDKNSVTVELTRALRAPAGRDPTLKPALQGALKVVTKATTLSP
ncbi:caspase family protein [Rhizobium leguminosarum]|uniref:caspase family protein n=1 Tax=Rhizobium leguminosarum TaxID=384 RepID=UPI001C96C584|nr:caspase family protein [Rhizobium leguminosarum]MBY5357826.1 caspase family protein [Rhizobium leguminosarum]